MEISENSFESKDLEEINIYNQRDCLIPNKTNLSLNKGMASFTIK